MKAVFVCEAQHLARADILDMVPGDVLSQLKASDPSPEIRAYAIAHEGPAKGRMLGFGSVLMNYGAGVIRRLFDRLAIGTQLFQGHGATNGHAGRQSIGRIVGKSLEEIGGKLHAVVAAYVGPQFRSAPLDVASIEADIAYERDGNEYNAIDVDQVTGVALGNSLEDRPGFEGARLLGAVAFFEPGPDDLTDPKQNDFIPQEQPQFDLGDNDFIPKQGS